MHYDSRTRFASPPYNAQIPTSPSQPSSSPASHQIHGSTMYPKIGHHGHAAGVAHVGRSSPHQQTSAQSASSGLGIMVALKPEYRITALPHLPLNAGDIRRSSFQFDFELERKVLAEAEKESPNWTRFVTENRPTKSGESTSPVAPVSNPIVSKYIASGLSREAVPIAVANYGDNPTKVQEFVNGYTLLREMGFSSSAVADALVLHDNNTDKALAHFLSSSS